MLDIYLFTFSKKSNSTKQPVLSNGTKFEIVLKEQTNILTPTIKLKLDSSPVAYNYAYIPSMNRYYWISNWDINLGIWEASLKVDVLASWKSNIGASSEYVLRSAAFSNSNVIDNMYPAVNEQVVTINTITSPFTDILSNGTYVVGIVSRDASTSGPVTYVAMNPNQFRLFSNIIFSDSFYSNFDFSSEPDNWISEFMQGANATIKDMFKAFVDPFKYIVSCRWYPMSISGVSSSFAFNFGWWEITAPHRPTGSVTVVDEAHLIQTMPVFTIAVPKHPQASARGNYLNGSPYSQYTLSLHPFGEISIDASMLLGVNNIVGRVEVDIVTGIARLTLNAGGEGLNNNLKVVYSTIGVPISMNNANNNYGALFAPVMDLARGAVGDVSGALALSGDIINAAKFIIPEVSTKGENCGILADKQINGDNVYLTGRFTPVVAADNTDMGSPLCERKLLSTCTGYTKLAHGDISLPCTDTEYIEIRAYLEGGYFYE